MPGTRPHVVVIDAAGPEQALGHAPQRRRSEHAQVIHLAGADVPALQHQAAIVHAVVVVQMGEQRVRDLGRREAALDQPLMRAGPVIQHDRLVADLHQIARALPFRRRRRRAGPEQCQLHRCAFGRSRQTVWLEALRQRRYLSLA
jgi:hypothetical protein